MTIKTFEVNPLRENCYVVSDETKQCVIIDCGCSDEHEWEDIKKHIDAEGLEVKHLLNTHLHFDHVWARTTFSRSPESFGDTPKPRACGCGLQRKS